MKVETQAELEEAILANAEIHIHSNGSFFLKAINRLAL